MKKTKTLRIIMAAILTLLIVFCEAGTVFAATGSSSQTKLSKNKIDMKIGQTAVLSVKNANKKVTWSISSKIASLQRNGKNAIRIKAQKSGSAVITAKVGNKKYKCSLLVKKEEMICTDQNGKKLEKNKNGYVVNAGKTVNVQFENSDISASEWEVKRSAYMDKSLAKNKDYSESIAEKSENGIVLNLNERGKVTIRAQLTSGSSIETTVYVLGTPQDFIREVSQNKKNRIDDGTMVLYRAGKKKTDWTYSLQYDPEEKNISILGVKVVRNNLGQLQYSDSVTLSIDLENLYESEYTYIAMDKVLNRTAIASTNFETKLYRKVHSYDVFALGGYSEQTAANNAAKYMLPMVKAANRIAMEDLNLSLRELGFSDVAWSL